MILNGPQHEAVDAHWKSMPNLFTPDLLPSAGRDRHVSSALLATAAGGVYRLATTPSTILEGDTIHGVLVRRSTGLLRHAPPPSAVRGGNTLPTALHRAYKSLGGLPFLPRLVSMPQMTVGYTASEQILPLTMGDGRIVEVTAFPFRLNTLGT